MCRSPPPTQPNYYIIFGEFMLGQVLDLEQITNNAQINFPPNVYQMYAILGPDNQWTITQRTPQNIE